MVSTSDDTLVWDTAARDGAQRAPGRRAGGPAGRPGLRGRRRRRRAQRLRPRGRRRRRAAHRAHRLQRQRPVGADHRVLPGRLAAGRGAARRGWRCGTCATPRRRAGSPTGTPPAASPTALAVLDDGRVLASGSSDQLNVWDALGDGSSRTVVPGRSRDARSSTSTRTPPAPRCSSTRRRASRTCRWSTSSPARPWQSYQATDPGRPAVVAAADHLDHDHGPGRGRPWRAFDLAGRGFVFDTADGHLLTGLTGGHTSLVSEAGVHRRRAAGHRQRRRVAAAVGPRPGRRAGRRLDDRQPVPGLRRPDRRRQLASWPSGTTTSTRPARPPTCRPRAPLEGVDLGRRGRRTTGGDAAHRRAAGHLRRPRPRRSRPGSSRLGTGTHDHLDQGRPVPDGGERRRRAATRRGRRSRSAGSARPGRSRRRPGAAAAAAASRQRRQPTSSPSTLDRDGGDRPAGLVQPARRHPQRDVRAARRTRAATSPSSATTASSRCWSAGGAWRRSATPSIGTPTSAGVVAYGDSASCDVDDITVTTAP